MSRRSGGSQGESLRRAIGGTHTAAAATPTGTPVIVVAAGKGGVGTSSVATIVAMTLAASGRRTLLVDADDQFGALHLLLGVARGATLHDLRGGLAPEALAVPVHPQLSLVSGGSPFDAAPLPPAERRALWRRLATLYERHDIVVIDAGARVESLLAACTPVPDRIVAVTTEDHVAVAATYALLKLVAQRLPGTPVEVVTNRADAPTGLAVAGHLGSATEQFLARSLSYAGAIPEDPAVADALAGRGGSLPPEIARHPAITALAQLAERLAGDLTRSRSGEARPSTDGTSYGSRPALASARGR